MYVCADLQQQGPHEELVREVLALYKPLYYLHTSAYVSIRQHTSVCRAASATHLSRADVSDKATSYVCTASSRDETASVMRSASSSTAPTKKKNENMNVCVCVCVCV